MKREYTFATKVQSDPHMISIHCHYVDTDSNCGCVRLIILKAMTVLNYFSIIFYFTPDIGHQEQMSIIVRIVTIHEAKAKVKV
jgi:hypothetical protein